MKIQSKKESVNVNVTLASRYYSRYNADESKCELVKVIIYSVASSFIINGMMSIRLVFKYMFEVSKLNLKLHLVQIKEFNCFIFSVSYSPVKVSNGKAKIHKIYF